MISRYWFIRMINLKFYKLLAKTQDYLIQGTKRFMDTLRDKNLIDIYGKLKPAKAILKNKKCIVYYFSASWCGPCKALLPKVKAVYEENCKRQLGMEIIYVSLDTDRGVMLNYYKQAHGNWYAIPFGDETIEILRTKYHVTHIPYITVVKNDGTIISRNGRKEIDELGVNVLVTWLH